MTNPTPTPKAESIEAADVRKLIRSNKERIATWSEVAERGDEGNEPLPSVIQRLSETNQALSALLARAEAAEAERDRIAANTTRYPDMMARIVAAKDQPLPDRIEGLISAMQALPEYLHHYQWEADAQPLFGEKRVAVCGNNGEGMGRQYIADTPYHITGLAEYIAAANPDTVAMLIAALTEALASLDAERLDALEDAATHHGRFLMTSTSLPVDVIVASEADIRALRRTPKEGV